MNVYEELMSTLDGDELPLAHLVIKALVWNQKDTMKSSMLKAD